MEAADAPSAEFPDEADVGESEEASENRPSPSSAAEKRAGGARPEPAAEKRAGGG